MTPQDVNDFGVYLGDLGYKVTGKESQGSQIAYALSNGSIEFTMIYDSTAFEMKLSYPAGTDYEKPLFPGYQFLNIGEELDIRGLGKLTFENFYLDQKINVYTFLTINYRGEWREYSYENLYGADWADTWLKLHFFNTTSATKSFSTTNNDLFRATLIYINEYDTFNYPAGHYGRYFNIEDVDMICETEGKPFSISVATTYSAFPIEPMDEAYGGLAFDIPESIRTSNDGTLAITIDFVSGDKYVIVLRSNGRNLY